MAISLPVPEAKPCPRFPVLSTRQDAFCRHFVASGNAADAARRAGYAESSARQTGHALIERPHIIERVRRIRLLWRETARQEARILIERLEQAWQVAAAQESSFMMVQVIRLQADLSGLSRRGMARRVDLWPLPDEDEFGELDTALEAADAGAHIAARPGPLAEALGTGRTGTAAPPAAEGPAEREPAPDEAPVIAPDDPAVYDDPPEEHYDAVEIGVAPTGPDLQQGDDSVIDSAEFGWLYALRNGFDPIDPSSEEQFALQAENDALLAANPSGIAYTAMPPADSAPAETDQDESGHFMTHSKAFGTPCATPDAHPSTVIPTEQSERRDLGSI